MTDDSDLSLDFHTVELEQNDREELERYKKIVDRLLSARKGRAVSFYLEEKHPGSFRMTVTAPKMDEKKIAEYISATLDIMKVSLLAHADVDRLMDSMKLSLERYEANK